MCEMTIHVFSTFATLLRTINMTERNSMAHLISQEIKLAQAASILSLLTIDDNIRELDMTDVINILHTARDLITSHDDAVDDRTLNQRLDDVIDELDAITELAGTVGVSRVTISARQALHALRIESLLLDSGLREPA